MTEFNIILLVSALNESQIVSTNNHHWNSICLFFFFLFSTLYDRIRAARKLNFALKLEMQKNAFSNQTKGVRLCIRKTRTEEKKTGPKKQ